MAMWKAKTKDGKEVGEMDTKWNDIKDNISELLMITNDGRTIYLPKNLSEYNQFKTASCELGNNSNIQIESRVIGGKIGSNMFKIRVNEKTNNITVEID
jgi:hypothetical protein